MITVEIAAGNIFTEFQSLGQKLILGVIGYNIIGTVLHIITPSKWERIFLVSSYFCNFNM